MAIEERGLVRFSEEEDMELEQAFKTWITGLAVRYYKIGKPAEMSSAFRQRRSGQFRTLIILVVAIGAC